MMYSWPYYAAILIREFVYELWDINIFMHFEYS